MPASEPSDKEDKLSATQPGQPTPASGTRRDTGSRPVRLDAQLLNEVSVAARASHRSLPYQLEYWTRLGQLVEHCMSGEELRDALSGTRQIESVRLGAPRVDIDDVLASLAADRANGSLQKGVTGACVVYDIDASHDTLLRRTDSNGVVTLGNFLEGRFVEQDASG